MNLFLGKGFKVSDDLQKYYDERNTDIDTVLRELRWLEQHCFENTIIRRRNFSELADTLQEFITKVNEHRGVLSLLHSRRVSKLEEEKLKAIKDSCVVLKSEGSKDGSIPSKNAIKVVSRMYNLVQSYKTTEI